MARIRTKHREAHLPLGMCSYPVSLTDQWGKVPRTPFVVQLMDRAPGSIELNGFRSSFRHRPLMECKNAEWFLRGLAWLNVYRVDLVLFQQVNEVRSTLLDRCEARCRA